LEASRSARGAKPPVKLRFEGNRLASELTIVPKSLKSYDSLMKRTENESNG
jgi:hypothetical protein